MKKLITLAIVFGFPFAANALKITNPINVSDPEAIIGNAIEGILGITGSIALLFFVYGGITWMTARGQAEQIDRGRKILVWAVIGLIVIFSSYAILSQFFTILGN